MRIFQVDAFTDQIFKGNPAAVCILEEVMPDEWMRQLAAEMNLSETAFLLREGSQWRLRWFTPKVEVPLCGHGTLASSHVLYETRLASREEILHFQTRSGELSARTIDDWIELNFPLIPVVKSEPIAALVEGINKEPIFFGLCGENALIELDSETKVKNLNPDFETLLKACVHGLIVTARAQTSGVDFVSRYFGPWVGINEDPVTGSAHCSLAPYWGSKLGKTALIAHQISARGGVLQLRVEQDRVAIMGQAVTVFSGSLSR